MTNRRDFIKNTAVLATGITIAPSLACKTTQTSTARVAASTYPTANGYVQEKLPYAFNALEPHIDALTMEIHYTKHHTAYIKKLNEVKFAHQSMMGKSLEELLQNVSKLPEDVRTIVRNNGGGHWNHAFFWKILAPSIGQQLNWTLFQAVIKKWGSLETFKAEFEKAGTNRFGSGWVWLVKTDKGLEITSTPNQDNPLMDVVETQGIPLLALDVWEHAYYLNYQNKRADYLKSFWNIVNWEHAEMLFAK